ncbi:ABC transporter ATP-binding protein [Lusitaniella coriacea LEGE 07157]|uniref:ABC transporter ATP-binding protein n=1 Tax=Lusitaniella coriacea LEGE 07157 TaxID=945747 RepID=A0A8J7J2D1_9CYAN|nr:ABC transporter ATP-binding protein [Lusitaniella coriacea]MBE9116329.1 ABC transporter ATP-binding protein [Lusitaniella coriacea LEGE 07157]
MIEVEHLSKTYGINTAIDDISFSVEKGEILGFLGPNGAGKTTTMRILSGYLPATTGTARVAGFDVHEASMDVRRSIGYLPETPPLYLDMTVEGFLYFVARIKGIPAGDRATQVNFAIERCNLQEKRKVIIRKLSKGFRQRVGIAQAIVHNPPAIVLDEPTVGLDPKQIIEVRNLIKTLAGDHTIILSTHILPEASMTCDRVAIINRGKMVATDTPDNLMAQLTEGSGYELEVEGNIEQLRPLLQEVPGVREVEVTKTPEPENLNPTPFLVRYPSRSRLRIVSSPGSEPGRAIATAIVSAGLGLYEMRRVRPTLEDVFLQLTTEELHFEPEDRLGDDGEAFQSTVKSQQSSDEKTLSETGGRGDGEAGETQ